MAQFQKETPEETAFRKQMDACKSVLSSALSADLPSGTDYHYFKTFASFASSMEELRARAAAVVRKFPGAAEGGAEALADPDDALNWMVDVMDKTVERVDRAVDEAYSLLSDEEKVTIQSSQNHSAVPTAAGQVAGTHSTEKQRKYHDWIVTQMAAGHTLRPQSDFQDKIDNSKEVFKGKLHHWRELQQGGAVLPRLKPLVHKIRLDSAPDQPPHPLVDIVEDLCYPDSQLQPSPPIKYRGLEVAPLTFVETEDQLREMAARLEDSQELAVDLEHHSFRSFQGITCLMQLSNREEDFIVDVLKLRSHIGPILGPFFADPQVVKVLHGADWDVQWLQRDFGIYIANLFDTGQACRVLAHRRLGLAFILEHYCQVKTDKRYQLADWRIRPLPAEMTLYARMDTHYLLYMYDCLKRELVSARDYVPPHLVVPIPAGKPDGALGTVLERSRHLSLKRYNKPIMSDAYVQEMLAGYKTTPVVSSREQAAVLSNLVYWRDKTAREQDESVEYIIGKRQLFSIAKAMPRSLKELKTCLRGETTPSAVHNYMQEILEVIARALQHAEQSSELQVQLSAAARPDSTVQDQRAVPAQIAWQGPALHTGLKPDTSNLIGQTSKQSPHAHPTAAQNVMGLLTPKVLSSQPAEASRVARAARDEALQDIEPDALEPSTSIQNQPAPVAQTPLAPGTELPSGTARTGSSLAESTPADIPLDTDSHPASAPTPALPSTSAFTKPVIVLPSKRSSLGALFGGAKGSGANRPPNPGEVPSAMAGISKLKAAQDQAAVDTAEKLRAEFAIPFPMLPMDGPVKREDQRHKAEQASSGSVMEAASGKDVRMVADALRAESAAEEAGPAAARVSESLGDFLPLPISQRYPKHGKRRRSDDSEQPGEPSGDADSEERDKDTGAEQQDEGNDAAINAVMREAGLESGSDAENSTSDADDHPAERLLGPIYPRSPKRSKKSTSSKEMTNAFGAGYPHQQGDVAKNSSLLAPLAVEETRSDVKQMSARHSGEMSHNAAEEAEPAEAFDYSAARAAAPGLDLGLSLEKGRGRGRRGRGRGGRGRGRMEAASPDAYNLYQLDEAKMMKGGKRSAVMPRSGNRTSTFR